VHNTLSRQGVKIYFDRRGEGPFSVSRCESSYRLLASTVLAQIGVVGGTSPKDGKLRVISQGVEFGVDVQIEEFPGSFSVGFLQPGDSGVSFAQRQVDSGQTAWRDIARFSFIPAI
jgi:hypothetical protein